MFGRTAARLDAIDDALSDLYDLARDLRDLLMQIEANTARIEGPDRPEYQRVT